MGLIASLKRLVSRGTGAPVARLYDAIVAEARRPDWYLEGQVPDTLDGRFDMIVLTLSLLLLRLEEITGGDPRHPAAQLSADLADHFLTDMEGNLLQDGIGEQVVPKHLGKMMAALGGRLGAYRGARGDAEAMADAIRRNLLRGEDAPETAVNWLVAESQRLSARLAATPFARLAAGELDAA